MERLKSLNDEFSELELKQLEERLETDPLAVSGFLNLSTNVSVLSDFCWDYESTGDEVSCGIYI